MKYSILNLLLLFIASNSFGQTEEELVDPIDSVFSLCIEKDPSTLGITGCYILAEKEWDKSEDKYYKLLLKSCGTVLEKQALQNSRALWEKYRIAELELYRTLYNRDGTMWSVVRADASMNLIKRRAMQLREYYETANQH